MVDVLFPFPLDMQDGLPENNPDSALSEDEVRSPYRSPLLLSLCIVVGCILEAVSSLFRRALGFSLPEAFASNRASNHNTLIQVRILHFYMYLCFSVPLGASRLLPAARLSDGCRTVSL